MSGRDALFGERHGLNGALPARGSMSDSSTPRTKRTIYRARRGLWSGAEAGNAGIGQAGDDQSLVTVWCVPSSKFCQRTGPPGFTITVSGWKAPVKIVTYAESAPWALTTTRPPSR